MSAPPLPPGKLIVTYPTPRVEDKILYEAWSTLIPGNNRWKYGDRHPNAVLYPHHVLVYVEPPARGYEYSIRYWASERELEDEYNYQLAKADIGGTKFDAVVRTYTIRRRDFTPNDPLMGSPMPNVPLGRWDATKQDPEDMFLADYVLAERSEKQTDDKRITSLFIQEQRTYIKRCSITDINVDEALGVGSGRVTNLYYRGEIVNGMPVEDLFADVDNPFWTVAEDGTKNEGQQLSEAWFAIVSTSSTDAALLSYKLVMPGATNLSLPDVLESISVVWNKAFGDGSFNSEWEGVTAWSPANAVRASLNGQESATAEGSASIQPDLNVSIRQSMGRGIKSASYYFYMKTADGTVSDAAFLARVSALAGASVSWWPTFHPKSHTIVLRGQKVAVSAKASASASLSAGGDNDSGDGNISKDKNEGSGTNADYSTMNGLMKLPPTIHGAITIFGTTSDSSSATATCDVGWATYDTGQVIAAQTVAFPPTTAAATVTQLALGSVFPTGLTATTPSSIPSTGLYIVNSSVSPYKAGWVKCFAEVVNAANI